MEHRQAVNTLFDHADHTGLPIKLKFFHLIIDMIPVRVSV
jgi:hypothetical protein